MSDQPFQPAPPVSQVQESVIKYVQGIQKKGQQELLALASVPGALGAAIGKEAGGQAISAKMREKLQKLNDNKAGVYFFNTGKSQYFEYRGGVYYQVTGETVSPTPMTPGFQPASGPLPAIEGGAVKLKEFVAPGEPGISAPLKEKKIPGARFVDAPKPGKQLVQESPNDALRRLRKLDSLKEYDLFHSRGQYWATQVWKKFEWVDPETGTVSPASSALPPGKYDFLGPGKPEFQTAHWDPYKEQKRQGDLRKKLIEQETRGPFKIGDKDPYPLLCGGCQVEVNGELVYVAEFDDYWRLTAGPGRDVVVQGDSDDWVRIYPDNPDAGLSLLSNVDYRLCYDNSPLDLTDWEFRFGVIIANWSYYTEYARQKFLGTHGWGASRGMIHVPFRTDKYTMHASVEDTYFRQSIEKILEAGREPWRGCMADLAGSVHHLTIEYGGFGDKENPRLFPTGKTWVYSGDGGKALPKNLLGPDTYFKQARDYLRDWGP